MNGLGPDWKDRLLHKFPLCSVKGELRDASGGAFICKYKPLKKLGEGTFGYVDLFTRKDASGAVMTVAMKRPKFPEMKLLDEGIFQQRLHNDLAAYGLGHCVPKVYDIFVYQPTGDVWFTMEAFKPVLLSQWCVANMKEAADPSYLFVMLLLQIALIIEVLESEMKIDHRDLKVNNMIVVDESTTIEINWKGVERAVEFPFRIVIVDFGFACLGKIIDVRSSEGLPPLHACPREGRNIFQVLVSLWNIHSVRMSLGEGWGAWIREKISEVIPLTPCVALVESAKGLDWMYTLTENPDFRAPLCVAHRIIKDCIHYLHVMDNDSVGRVSRRSSGSLLGPLGQGPLASAQKIETGTDDLDESIHRSV